MASPSHNNNNKLEEFIMCNSNGFNGNCCPSAQIFQEKICGNLTGPLNDFLIWSVPATFVNDYIQGTFEIFNAGPGTITANINDNGTLVGGLNVPPGTSQAVSVNSPGSVTVDVPAGTAGRFCITLYKRVLA